MWAVRASNVPRAGDTGVPNPGRECLSCDYHVICHVTSLVTSYDMVHGVNHATVCVSFSSIVLCYAC